MVNYERSFSKLSVPARKEQCQSCLDNTNAVPTCTLCRFHVLENGTLLVQEVHMADSGKYGCTAGNSGGFKREEVTLIVRSE